MRRLTIDITDQQHHHLKDSAALEGKTIKQYVLGRLFPGGACGDEAWQELKSLLVIRINEGLAGKHSAKTVHEILDEELAENRRSSQLAY